MNHDAVIVGAGTYGEVYLYYLRQAGVRVAGFLDDRAEKIGSRIDGVPVLGTTSDIEHMLSRGIGALYAPIGSNAARVRFHERARSLGISTPNFVHPSAVVDSDIEPNIGVLMLPGVTIMPLSTIGPDVMISANASVAHHSTLERGVFLSTKASVGASIRVGQCTYIGMGATLVTGKVRRVGANVTIGASATVLTDLPDGIVAAGTPARVLR